MESLYITKHKQDLHISMFQDHVSITAGFITFTLTLVGGILQSIVFLQFGKLETYLTRLIIKLLVFAITPVYWIHKNEKMKKYAKKSVLCFKE